MKPRKMFTQLLGLLALLMTLPVLVAAQTPAPSSRAHPGVAPDEVVRVDTNLVTIPATVMDRGGRYITDLRKEDFQILEDGVEQQVSFFASVDQPFTILFLLDVSASMGYRLADLNHAANVFLDQLRPDDRLIAIEFSDRVRELCKVTSVREVREGKKLKLHPGGGTMLYDAVDDALKRMKKMRERRAIVLFSDGYGGGVFASARRNLRDSAELGALIYTVQFDSFLSRENDFKEVEKVNSYMRDLAEKTGGRHYWVEKISNLEETFGLVAEELGRQYSLGYYPKTKLEAGQQRHIKVKVRVPNLVVRARESYVVDKDRVKGK